VDKDDLEKYFSAGPERIFTRKKAVRHEKGDFVGTQSKIYLLK